MFFLKKKHFFLYISFSYMYVHIDEGKSCGHGLGFQSLNKIQDCATRRSAQISTKKFNLRKVLLLYYDTSHSSLFQTNYCKHFEVLKLKVYSRSLFSANFC